MMEYMDYILLFIGITIGLLFFTIISFVTDSVPINAIGKYMCEQNGLEFVDAKINVDNIDNNNDFKVWCKKDNEINIQGGYLLLVGEDKQ